MKIQEAFAVFEGKALLYKPKDHTFELNKTISRVVSNLLFQNPQLVTKKSLETDQATTREFFKQIDDEFLKREDPSWILESQRLITNLETIDNPIARETVSKIKVYQSLYKHTIKRFDETQPDFVKNDLNLNKKIIKSFPDDLLKMPISYVKAHKELACIALSENPKLINKIPEEILRENFELVKDTLRAHKKYFFDLPAAFKIDLGQFCFECVDDQDYLNFIRIPDILIETFPDEALKTILDNQEKLLALAPESIVRRFEDVFITLMETHPKVARIIPEDLQLKYSDLCADAFDKEPLLIIHASSKLLCLKPELAISVVSKQPSLIEYIPKSIIIDHPDFFVSHFIEHPNQGSWVPMEFKKDEAILNRFIDQFISDIAPGKEEGFRKTILGFHRPEQRFKIINALCQIKKNNHMDFMPKWVSTESTTPIFAKAMAVSFFSPEEANPVLDQFLLTFKKDLKDYQKRQTVLNLIEAIAKSYKGGTSQREVLKKALTIDPTFASKAASLDEIMKRSKTLPLLMSLEDWYDAKDLGEINSEKIKETIQTKLVDWGIVEYDQLESFGRLFENSRNPEAIYSFLKGLGANIEAAPYIKEFISSLLKGTFEAKRHENNSYSQLFESDDQKTLWETKDELSVVLNRRGQEKEFVIYDSEDWQDLFLSGTEIEKSCQTVTGDPELFVGLLGTVLDGKIKEIVIKESRDAPIKARSLLKLIKNPEGRLCLFLEPTYPVPDGDEAESILNFAKLKAEKMGLELYQYDLSIEPPIFLTSDVKNHAHFEYEDAIFSPVKSEVPKITDGTYRVGAKKIV